MEIIKLMINGRPQGIYAITKKEEVTDVLLDKLNQAKKEDKYYARMVLDAHLKSGLYVVPVDEKPFDWDEDLHGKFFT